MKASLRLRFFAAMALVVAAIVGAFAFGLWQFVEVLEQELLQHTLTRELQQFADRYAHEPAMAPPQESDLRGYIQRAGAPDGLPAELRDLPAGVHPHVRIEGREAFAGRADVDGARLYLVMDAEPVEALEQRLVGLALLCGVGAFTLAALASMILARVVLRPVTRLAVSVAALDPQRRGARVGPLDDGDPEIGHIAAAMDRYLERLDLYIEREQAFTEDASHELRTPLATMLTAAQLLLAQPGLPPQSRERLARIARAGEQMQALIEALLFLAREDGGAGAPRDCALDELVREAVDHCAAAAHERGIAFDVQLAPARRRVHAGMAASVINNLLLNTVQHSGPGKVEVRLEGGQLVVQDSGAGIAAADLPRIFERRYRGAGSAGHGLGLYLVKRICDRLGWSVEASSLPTGGARFTVLLGDAALTEN